MKLPKVKAKYASVKLNDWELLTLEEALNNGLPYVDKDKLEHLIKKIQNAVTK